MGLAAILLLTLVPTSGPDTGVFKLCVLCGDSGVSDFGANILLFAPAALGLALLGVPLRKAIAALAALSLTIELVQLRIPGRESTLGDVVSNSLGAGLGAALAVWLPRWRRSEAWALAAATAGTLVLAGTAWILGPVFPPTDYYGQWTPVLGQFAAYGGKVLGADVAGVPVRGWELDNSPVVRGLLQQGGTVHVQAVAGPPPPRLAPIFAIADGERRGIILIGASGADLAVRVSTRAQDIRLPPRDLRWPGALASVRQGDTLAIELRRESHGLCVVLNGREHCGLAFSPGAAWRLFSPWPRSGPLAALGDWLWLAVLALPVGLLVERRPASAAPIALVLAGTLAAPVFGSLVSAGPADLLASLAGVAAGWWLPVPMNRRQERRPR